MSGLEGVVEIAWVLGLIKGEEVGGSERDVLHKPHFDDLD